MKWRLKKHISSSSSPSLSSFSSISHCSQPSSLISQMFPLPWLSKFKRKNTTKPEPKPRKSSHSVLPTNPLKCPSLVCENGHGKFYSFEGDGDKFWRLSFGQDSAGDKSERVGPKPPVWCDDESKSAEEMMSFDLQSLKEKNKQKSEAHRKSLYVSLEKQKNNKKKKKSRVRASSPRAEPCKVKALEDMKRSKVKKKSAKERVQLDGFAIAKSSYDPQKDFKDSMVEMISEKKMRSPEELEELLACYLTLNSDECHGLIVKVFREVWLELGEFENQNVFS